MKKYVDIHGSCVSRSIFNDSDELKIGVNLYMNRQCLVSAMMPPANLPTNMENLLPAASEFQNRCLQYALDKSTVPRLLESESEILILDLFDLCQNVVMFDNTTFSSYDTFFYRTNNYKDNSKKMGALNFFEVPLALWCGYVDMYFQNILRKYKKVILCRLQCCNIYVSKSKEIKTIGNGKLLFGDAKYNEHLRKLEQYVIDKYPIISVDITQYFTPDENFNSDVTPVHYEKLYYQTSITILEDILINGNSVKYFDLPISAISPILRRDLSDENYIKYHKSKKSPFNSLGFLNSFFASINDVQLIENRIFIADIYDSATDYFKDKDCYDLELWNNFLVSNKELFTKSEYLMRILLKALEHIIMYRNSSEENLINVIESYIDGDNIDWRSVLNTAYCIYRNSSKINHLVYIYIYKKKPVYSCSVFTVIIHRFLFI